MYVLQASTLNEYSKWNRKDLLNGLDISYHIIHRCQWITMALQKYVIHYKTVSRYRFEQYECVDFVAQARCAISKSLFFKGPRLKCSIFCSNNLKYISVCKYFLRIDRLYKEKCNMRSIVNLTVMSKWKGTFRIVQY